MELQRLEALITGGVSISNTAARAEVLQQGEKIQFDYAALSAADLKSSIREPTMAPLCWARSLQGILCRRAVRFAL